MDLNWAGPLAHRFFSIDSIVLHNLWLIESADAGQRAAEMRGGGMGLEHPKVSVSKVGGVLEPMSTVVPCPLGNHNSIELEQKNKRALLSSKA